MAEDQRDHLVRPKFKQLLEPSYKPFRFADLPVELSLRILIYATAYSQGTYRSLLLVNKKISGWIVIEMLSGVPIILADRRQLEAFESYLMTRPEVIPHIRNLWTICPTSVISVHRLCVSIINRCTHLRSLACHPHILFHILNTSELQHTRCVDLTLIEFRIRWGHYMQSSTVWAQFFNQLRRLHFIGAMDHFSTLTVIPKLENIARVSVALGSSTLVQPVMFEELMKSPKLGQVVITSRLHGDAHKALSDAAQQIDDRFSVMHRRRRWKEHNLWRESLQDPDRFWKQATEEKFLSPAQRR
ncbi:hypothetical protein GGX14DRAFT_622923 [Mycena pura]|uniref:Uncharacterized protein n=1 Tax=Mycena pura TaxID=153505 RepID=A0AAD6VNX4_9AGAR|nr:hypothetical protein GGX14DRAFT_622923 [Mycena pura]